MRYEGKKLTAELRAARERKGLSQRELSGRSGVPQSHISKIETSGVNLTISSLAAIANALDLEIALIPRKAVPAVKSIVRSVDDVPRASPDARRELAGIAKQLDHIKELNIDTVAFDNLQRQFSAVQQVENLIKATDVLRSVKQALKTVDGIGEIKALQNSADRLKSLSDALARAGVGVGVKTLNLPRAAYRLDEDSDG